jgi:hypothetical protein
MALTRNTEFMERCQAMMARVAGVVLSEPGSTPYHGDRAYYAKLVAQNAITTTQQAAPQIVMGVNVIPTTTYDELLKTSTSTIADIDLESQITTLWNALGGINTPA